MTSTAGAGALAGSFWGLLFGLIFFVPILGLAIGAGAVGGGLTDVGIDDDFINQGWSCCTQICRTNRTRSCARCSQTTKPSRTELSVARGSPSWRDATRPPRLISPKGQSEGRRR